MDALGEAHEEGQTAFLRIIIAPNPHGGGHLLQVRAHPQDLAVSSLLYVPARSDLHAIAWLRNGLQRLAHIPDDSLRLRGRDRQNWIPRHNSGAGATVDD